MPMNETSCEKLACAYFFITPALAYGTLSARLPALQLITGADDAQIGSVLLALGICTLAGLLLCGFVIEKFNARLLAVIGSSLLAAAMCVAAIARSWHFLAFGCGIAGLGVGLCDVSMNALGIDLEKRRGVLALSFLHGASSVGGVAGSLAGSMSAALGIAPFFNFLIVLGAWLCLCPLAARRAPAGETPDNAKRRFPLFFPGFVILCGVLSLVCHIVEGSAAEWGSLLLYSVKHASQQEAALAFAFFTGGMVACRFTADWLRKHVSDFILLFGGSLLGGAGMSLALLASAPWLCLCGYAIVGLGLAPVVPVLFSRAGASEGISAGRASAIVSVFSYSGMLLFPPFLGYLAQAAGLAHALWILPGCCALLCLGSLPFLRRPRKS